MIRALVLDLDDTIFKISSINPNLVQPFFDRLQELNAILSEDDFIEIFINDPMQTARGKLKIFSSILESYNYNPKELLVIGDNPDNEIKAGKQLGMYTLTINRDQASQKPLSR